MPDERIPTIGSQTRQPPRREYQPLGGPTSGVAALAHFIVAVSSIVIARAAVLIRPWHRARGVAKPIANIAVGAVTAWHRPPAATVLQGIIPARLKSRRHRPVRVALAVALIEIVAVAARRRMAMTAVPDFLGQCFLGQDFLNRGDAFVQGVGRHSQLQRERYAGQAGEHLSVPPVNAASLRPISAPRKWLRGLYACISMLCVCPGGPAWEIWPSFHSGRCRGGRWAHREETLTPWRLNGHQPPFGAA